MSSPFFTIMLAALGFGAAGEGMRRYRAYKTVRRSLPFSRRNAGFWTDRKIYRVEAVATTMAVSVPFSAIVPLVAAGRSVLIYYPLLWAYVGVIYLILRNMNVPERQ